MVIHHMKGRQTKDFKLSYNDIIDILLDIDLKHIKSSKKRRMFIIGGTSLMIRELNNRQLTQDIDSFELMEDNKAYWFKPITSLNIKI